ncbi:MAG: ABC transporter permease subunit [Bacteroidota bacterium]
MLKYIIKRLVLFVPIFLVVSMIAFGLSKLAPGDPAEVQTSDRAINSVTDIDSKRRSYRQNAERLGLDKPAFYFTWTTAAYPDTLYKFLYKDRRTTVKKLCAQYGHRELIESYYRRIALLEQAVAALPDSLKRNDDFINIRNATQDLFIAYKSAKTDYLINEISTSINDNQQLSLHLQEDTQALRDSYTQLQTQATPQKNYLPRFYWYGFDNQYHHWLTSFLSGDFGISTRDFRPVSDKIKDGLYWTLVMNLSALFFAYLLSIPLGVWSARKRGTKTDRRISLSLFLLYSIPSFWIATMLIIYFTTPTYGMKLFPSYGLGSSSLSAGDAWWTVFTERVAHLILPVFCSTYAALAFLTRQMRAGMVEVLDQNYIRTARAKGLSERKVIWKHAFRNALFPLITILGAQLPALIAGSVIIEVIFSIPGMGNLMFNSIYTQDWPVVYTILMMGAVLTMLGILLSDLLYAAVDPRVRLS